MNQDIDAYLAEGCGRCKHYQTPQCKVHAWNEVLVELRQVLLSCDLQEERKWSVPCYTHAGKNIVIMAAFKDYACLSFFKGALLEDPKSLLVRPTENMQAGRQLRFTKKSEVTKAKSAIRAFVREAIQVAMDGKKVEKKRTEDFDVPGELTTAFAKDPKFEKAFSALTPGRQRGYLIHFAGAKQSATRAARIEKHKKRIFDGLGLHDR